MSTSWLLQEVEYNQSIHNIFLFSFFLDIEKELMKRLKIFQVFHLKTYTIWIKYNEMTPDVQYI